MGYTTDFDGELTINPPLNAAQVAYINKFNQTRRMKRHTDLLSLDPVREAVGLPVGVDGAYFVGGGGPYGQARDRSIIDYNSPPEGQPGLWCQWCVSDDGTVLIWDEGEKFYHYTAWLEYLAEHFFSVWGCKLNGNIAWSGEDGDDRGTIYVKDNEVEEVYDSITNPGPSWTKRS